LAGKAISYEPAPESVQEFTGAVRLFGPVSCNRAASTKTIIAKLQFVIAQHFRSGDCQLLDMAAG
jgi:hypothetical protein